MRGNILLLGLLVLLGLAGAYFLLPRDQELALMLLRTRHYDAAKESYQRQLAAGDDSVAVIVPLADIHLAEGDVEKAIALLEDFVARNPTLIQARRRLGEYYQDAQRRGDYLRLLEEIVAIEPSEADLRELADLYLLKGRYEDYAFTLRRLVENGFAFPEDYQELIRYAAAAGRYGDAFASLKDVIARQEGPMTMLQMQLLVGLGLDSGHDEETLTQLRDWIARMGDPSLSVNLAQLMEEKERPDLALKLLRGYDQVKFDHPALLRQTVLLETSHGDADGAYELLLDLWRREALPGLLLGDFVEIAIGREDYEVAFVVARDAGRDKIANWARLALAERALEEKRGDFLDWLAADLGETFREDNPTFSARFALAAGEAGRALHWVRRAEKKENLTANEQIDLVRVHDGLGRREDAQNALKRLAGRETIPSAALNDLAFLFIRLDRERDGLALFERLRAATPSREAETGWARLAAKAGRDEALSAWLAGQKSVSRDMLEDLYYLAAGSGRPALALTVGKRLFADFPADGARRILAEAQLAAGKAGQAMETLTPLLPGNGDVQALYRTALAQGGADGKLAEILKDDLARAANDEERGEAIYALIELGQVDVALPHLRRMAEADAAVWGDLYVEALKAAGQGAERARFLAFWLGLEKDEGKREQLLYALMEEGDKSAALPFLKSLALNKGGEWAGVYREALAELGRRDELRAYVRTRLEREGMPRQERRELAFFLLEQGEKGLAEGLFLELAATEPADGENAVQLLFLWGPRPRAGELDWIEARAAASDAATRSGWLARLIDVGAPERVLNRLTPAMAAELSDAEFKIFADALEVSGDAARLEGAVEGALAAGAAPERLFRIGGLAEQMNKPELALAAYEQALDAGTVDREGWRRAANLSFFSGRREQAVERFGWYFALGGRDYESHFRMGEALAGLRRRDEAAAHFKAARALIEETRVQPYAMRLAEAQLLYRLGSREEALAAFEKLLIERPSDRSLRADYVSILLEMGKLRRAAGLLGMDETVVR